MEISLSEQREIEMVRSQTIIQGEAFCDFRFYLAVWAREPAGIPASATPREPLFES